MAKSKAKSKAKPKTKPRNQAVLALPKSKREFEPDELANRSLIRRAQLGNQQAMSDLTNKFWRMLWQMAVRSAVNDNDKEDFVSIAYLFFRDCVRSFDFRRDVKFITFCFSRIPLQLRRPRADYHNLIHIPAHAHLEGVRAPLIKSIQHFVRSSGDDGSDCSDFSHLMAQSSDIGAEIDIDERVARLRQIIAELPEEERGVIRRRMAGQTLKEIAIVNGTCKERVRQIELMAHEMIRCKMTGKPLPMGLRRRLTRLAAYGTSTNCSGTIRNRTL